jgi:hypothetical protein
MRGGVSARAFGGSRWNFSQEVNSMYGKMLLAGIGALMVTSFVPAPADAAPYRVIRWNVTHLCQIWDFGLPTRPWPGDYTIVSKRHATFGAAFAAEQRLVERRRCGW